MEETEQQSTTASVDATTTKPKKKLPILAVLGIGCLAIIVLSLLSFGIAFSVGGKFITSSLGQGFLKKTLENQMGIKLENGKNGESFSITNQKTGETVQLGETQIPADFPKDFPLYPGAAPGGSAVGSEKTTGKGFWLLLQTPDSLSNVTAYYSEQLEAKGWTIESTMSIGEGSTYKIKKEKLIGTVIISSDKKTEKTTILITLEPTNEQNPAPQDVAPSGAEPVEP